MFNMLAHPSPLSFFFRSIDCKPQIDSSNKNTLEANTKLEPESALASQVSARSVSGRQESSLMHCVRTQSFLTEKAFHISDISVSLSRTPPPSTTTLLEKIKLHEHTTAGKGCGTSQH